MSALGASSAAAKEAPSVFEGKVDTADPDLKLPEGKKLADPKVLDIKRIVGDEQGEEKREDSNADVTFQIQAEVLFGKDSAKLTARADSRIREIAEEIEKQDSNEVNVFGFTDDLGSYAHGKKLSKARANAVHRALRKEVSGGGITYKIRGYSEDKPIASNSTEEGRKKNRRVEVSFPRTEE
nr:OmpA family protein [Streptomyces sp. AJS327]